MPTPEQLPGKYVADSLTEQVCLVMPQHLNGVGKLFGGQLAAWIDTVAGVVALRHCNTTITTAAIDNLQFRESVDQNSLVVLKGRMVHTGTTSMEVRVDSYVEDLRTVAQRLINTAFVTEVALDENGRPRPVPPLIPVTPEEVAAFSAAANRKHLRRELCALFE
jgi:acyl-CoA hydrolase